MEAKTDHRQWVPVGFLAEIVLDYSLKSIDIWYNLVGEAT